MELKFLSLQIEILDLPLDLFVEFIAVYGDYIEV